VGGHAESSVSVSPVDGVKTMLVAMVGGRGSHYFRLGGIYGEKLSKRRSDYINRRRIGGTSRLRRCLKIVSKGEKTVPKEEVPASKTNKMIPEEH